MMKVQDIPALASAGVSGASAAWTWLVPLNQILQAFAYVVAIVSGLAALLLSIERIRQIRRDRNKNS